MIQFDYPGLKPPTSYWKDFFPVSWSWFKSDFLLIGSHMTGFLLFVMGGFFSATLHLSPVNLLGFHWVFGRNHGKLAGKHIGSIVKQRLREDSGFNMSYVKWDRHSEFWIGIEKISIQDVGIHIILANEIKFYCFFMIDLNCPKPLSPSTTGFFYPPSYLWALNFGHWKLVLGNQNRLDLFLGRLEQGQFCNFMKFGKKSLCIQNIAKHET